MGQRALRVLQVGKETTFGTSVPATAVMGGVTDFNFKPVIVNSQRRYLRGDYSPFHSVVQTDSRAQASITGDFTFEDFAILLESAIKGGVTGAVTDISAYTYSFPFPLTASPAVESRTWEFSDAQQGYKMTSGLVESFTLSGDANSDVVKFTAKLAGILGAKATITGALTARSMTPLAASQMNLYIDAIGGTIATTVKANTLISWTYTYNTGLHLKKFASATISPTLFGYGIPSATLQVIAEFNAVAVAEIDAHIAGTGRLYRLEGLGAIAGSTTTKYTLQIDTAGDIITMSDLWGDLNGNTTMDITISSRYDPGAFANWGKLTIINKTAALLG